MPIYAFKCSKCQHEYEELVPRINAAAPCPKCSSAKVSRMLTAPADYRGAGKAEPMCPTCPDTPASACPGGTCGLVP